MKSPSKFLASVAAGIMLVAAGAASGQTVAWGTSVSLTPLGYFSDGTVAGSGLSWTLGYFDNGFTPDATNYSDWAANYVEVDSAVEQSSPFYAVSGIKTNVGPEAAGRQAWIFAYNDLGKIGETDGEALLFAEIGFTFPVEPLSGTFDIEDNPANTNDDNFVVVWGQVDRDRDDTDGLITGGGEFSNQFGDTSTTEWEAQTATWPIPEPSIAILGAAGFCLLLRRRLRIG